jgi:hypothetical protein
MVRAPLGAALGGDDAELHQAVVGPGPVEDLDAGEHVLHVAHQHAGDRALEEAPALSTSTLARTGLAPRFFAPVHR